MKRLAGACLLILIGSPGLTVVRGQVPADIREMKLRDWQPQSMLVTRATVVPKAKFPVIDVHNHLGGGKAFLTPERVSHYLAELDATGVETVVNLDGGWDEHLVETLEALDQAHPGRFLTFALIDFDGIDEPGWTDRELKRLEAGFKAGAEWSEDSQEPGPGTPVQGPAARSGGRSEDRQALGALRQVPSTGDDPHRRPRRVLHSAGHQERTVARAERQSRLALPRQGLSRPRGASCPAVASDRSPSRDDVHLRPPGQRRRGPGDGGGLAGPLSEHVRGYRRRGSQSLAGSPTRRGGS